MSDGDDLAMRAAREIVQRMLYAGLGVDDLAEIIRRVVVEPMQAETDAIRKCLVEALAIGAEATRQLADATGETRNEAEQEMEELC